MEEKGAGVSGEKLDALLFFAKKEIVEGAKRIKEGEKGISPIRKEGDITACIYCPYHSICGFDEDIPNFRYRSMDSRKDEELWEEILKKTKEETGESGKAEEEKGVEEGKEESHE